ncbi:MAG: hypothetical protein D6772_05970, partial [Bacteroidetes bacterium]
MNKDYADELIAAYLAGDISAAEEQLLMAWVNSSSDNQKFFDQAVSIWEAAENYLYPDFEANKAAAFEQLNQRLEAGHDKGKAKHEVATQPPPRDDQGEHKVRHLHNRRTGLHWLRIAVAAVVILAVGWWWQHHEAPSPAFVAATPRGEQQTLTLPDGTQVWLNESSELSYHEQGGERLVHFQGEGYFEVATDSLRSFRVYTDQAVTTVLGTAFNLRAYPDETEVEVSVTEGRVALEVNSAHKRQTAAPAKRVELPAGTVGLFDRQTATLKTATTSVQNKLAWKEQVLDF